MIIGGLAFVGRGLLAIGIVGLALSTAMLDGDASTDGSQLSGLAVLLGLALVLPAALSSLWATGWNAPRPRDAAGQQIQVTPLWVRVLKRLAVLLLLLLLSASEAGLTLFELLVLLVLPALVYDLLAPSAAHQRSTLALQLALWLEMGATPVEAVEHLQRAAHSRLSSRLAPLPTVLSYLGHDMRQGAELSGAVAAQAYFPVEWSDYIRMGERSERLPQALRQLAELESSRISTRELLQPVFSLLLVLPVVHVTLSMVMPTFLALLAGLESQLSWSWRVVNEFLLLVQQVSFPALVAVVALWYFGLRKGRWFRTRLSIRLPGIGTVTRLQQLRVIFRNFLGAARLGRPVGEMLELASHCASISAYARALSRESVESGSSLTYVMKQHPDLFARELVGLVEVGETQEQLPEALEVACDYLDHEFAYRRAQLTHRLVWVLQGCLALLVLCLLLEVWIPLGEVQRAILEAPI